MDPSTGTKLRALLISEQELKNKVAELERRETAYLEMLTQADDMWAEMEGGYKKKIEDSQITETQLKGKVKRIKKLVYLKLNLGEFLYSFVKGYIFIHSLYT